MLNIVRTDSDNPDFKALIKLLDDELRMEYGNLQDYYEQFNRTNVIKHVVVAFFDNIPAGCGAIKKFDTAAAEVKRMFVKSEFRGRQIAKNTLEELELWAKELGFTSCVLETGIHSSVAVALYKKCGYQLTANYGQYIGVKTSICMMKRIGSSI